MNTKSMEIKVKLCIYILRTLKDIWLRLKKGQLNFPEPSYVLTFQAIDW